METKKNQKANLEKKRNILFQAGLISTMAAVLVVFEWSSPPRDNKDIEIIGEPKFSDELMVNTRQPPPEKPLPAEPHVPDELHLVSNDLDLDTELEIDVEIGMETEIPFNYTLEPDKTVEDSIFIEVQKMPRFQGQGKDAFRIYIQDNVDYPQKAIDIGLEGKVYVKFVVNKNGKVMNTQVFRSVHPLLDEAALEVIESSPEWTPGQQRDKPVNVQFIFPIYFKLAN